MQTSRLFEIIYLLMHREKITARELAERFEVSTRTVYRDIDVLSGAGIPVYATKGKGGGIGILPGFVLNRSVLSEEEQKEVLFGLQSLSASGAISDTGVLDKLKGVFQKDSADWIGIDSSDWGTGNEQRKIFELLKQAILGHSCVSFRYFDREGRLSLRTVEPYKLWHKGSGWYLHAYCLSRQGRRVFRLTRMEGLELTGQEFEPRDFPMSPLVEESPQPADRRHTVELWCSPRLAYRVYDCFSRDSITKNADGSFSVSEDYVVDSWVYGYLLSFGDEIRVISPKFLRDDIHQKAKNMCRLYGQPDSSHAHV